MSKFLRVFFTVVNSVVLTALLAIHFLFRECSFNASVLFYSFPLPVIIGVILMLSFVILKKFKIFNYILAGLLLILWLNRSFRIHQAEEIKESDLEIVFWNAAYALNLEDAFELNEGLPDVLVLAESGEYNLESIALKYPNYHFYKSLRDVSVFSKSKIEVLQDTTSFLKTNIVNFKTFQTNFYAIDATGSVNVPRDWIMKFVNNSIKNTKQTVLLGDFNLPFESVYFKKIKSNFSHTFSEKGNGFRETWFYNLPILSLDHIWVSNDLGILKMEKMYTFESDHTMLKTVIRH